MCLIVNSELKVAQEDIVCYKVLKYSCGSWVSPFRGMAYLKNHLYELGKSIQVDKHHCINEGFHSFIRADDAKKLSDVLDYFYEHYCGNKIYCVAKCIIPKGTVYAEGLYIYEIYGEKYHSYCSEKIKVVDIVEGGKIVDWVN